MYSQKKWGGKLKETVLWTNSSPTSAYATGNITLPQAITKFDYIKLKCRATTSNFTETESIQPIAYLGTDTDYTSYLMCSMNISNLGWIRHVTKGTSDSQVVIHKCYQIAGTGESTNYLIPLEIIGLKE